MYSLLESDVCRKLDKGASLFSEPRLCEIMVDHPITNFLLVLLKHSVHQHGSFIPYEFVVTTWPLMISSSSHLNYSKPAVCSNKAINFISAI